MIKENIKKIKENIKTLKKEFCTNEEIIIIAASKTFSAGDILEAKEEGIDNFGENYVQEAEKKFEGIEGIKKHLIGHLQTNKIKKAIKIFDVIQTLDSLELAEKIDKEAKNLGKTMPVFVEVNFAKEKTKSGILPEETLEFIKKISNLNNLKVIGLMSMAQKEYFSEMKELFDKTNLKYLSMGMSDDYLEAIKNGANMIRLGRAIFGERN